MFSEPLKKILDLIKKTGDRVIIFDPSAPENSYVLMDLDRYAQMVSAEELVQPHPVAPFKPQAALKPILEPVANGDSEPKIEKKENLTEEDLTDKINREILMWKNQDNASYLSEENKPKKPWQISPQVKEKAQGVE